MRIAVIADIHGNLSALEAIIADLRITAPDAVFHGGDLVANGFRPVEVTDRIREFGWQGVCGNTDEMLWRPERLGELEITDPRRRRLREVLFRITGPATLQRLGEERIAWLRTLPTVVRIGGLAILHASPMDLWRAPLAASPDAELTSTYEGLQAETVVYGHIHAPFVRVLPQFTVANTGAASLSYDGDPRACYALVEDGRVSHRRIAYDIEREASGLRNSGYPCADWLAEILRSGRYISPPAQF